MGRVAKQLKSITPQLPNVFYRIELTAVYVWISSSLLILPSSPLLSPQTPLYVGTNCCPKVRDFYGRAKITAPFSPPTYFPKDFLPLGKKKVWNSCSTSMMGECGESARLTSAPCWTSGGKTQFRHRSYFWKFLVPFSISLCNLLATAWVSC